jgi:hypothetical protein
VTTREYDDELQSEQQHVSDLYRRLDVADTGLCFGRLDAVSGERSYIGKGAGWFRGAITHAANRFGAPIKTTFPPRICGSTGPDPQVRY